MASTADMKELEMEHTELDRPDGNSLLENYTLHDVGHAHLVETMTEWGYDVEDWGLDLRENTGTLVTDDRLDFRIWDGARAVALMDVKTKSNPDWVGKMNESHYEKYAGYASRLEIPVVVGMYLLDGDDIVEEHYIPVLGGYEAWAEHDIAPDGNPLVRAREDYYRDRDWLRERLST